jgi:sialate O-acetylesterase
MPLLNRALRLAALAWLPLVSAYADVTLPALLSDHMVLQRGLPVHIWGKAAPGEKVSVVFRGAARATAADEIGHWSVYLPPSDAGGPFELTVKGNNAVTLSDVMVGEVWVDSGQSNMEFALRTARNAAGEVASADHPKIRRFHVNKAVSPFPQTDASAQPWSAAQNSQQSVLGAFPQAEVGDQAWSVCTPLTAGAFSAVAYFFAREIEAKLGVPVGLIDSYWEGTPVEAWMSPRALSSSAQFMPAFALWSDMIANYTVRAEQRQKRLKDWQDAVAHAQAEGKPRPPVLPFENNQGNSWMPAGLYNAMIAPLTAYPIGGAIWYQGESNATATRAPLYAAMFETMIRDWRSAWGVGDFPFLFVQLASYRTGPNAKWPEIREAQLQTLRVAKTGMAVTIDIGDPDNIHPANKQDVGKRLALAARAVAYGEKIEYSGPLLRAAAPEAGAIRLWFDHAGSGLEARGGALKGFMISGADRRFVTADASIDGSSVVVSNASVAQPLYVRYAWADNPECNLYNKDGLPASPFRWGE